MCWSISFVIIRRIFNLIKCTEVTLHIKSFVLSGRNIIQSSFYCTLWQIYWILRALLCWAHAVSSCKCFALRSLAEEREREGGKKKDKSSLVNHLFQYLMSDVISTPYKQECVSQYDCVLFNFRTKNMCFKRKKWINMKTAISYGPLFFLKFLFVSILRTLKQFLA